MLVTGTKSFMKLNLKLIFTLIAAAFAISFLLWQIKRCQLKHNRIQESNTTILDQKRELDLCIGIAPFGKLDSSFLLLLKREVFQFYKFETKLILPLTLPSDAYYPPRNRYKAASLLKYLEVMKPDDIYCIIGITDVDISTKVPPYEDWGIFGLGEYPGHTCIISTFRVSRASKTQRQFEERMVKIVLHELGHNFGLNHCKTPGCLMGAANGAIQSVDREEKALCEKCRQNPLTSRAPVLK